MKKLIILALSLVTITVSAQEVTEVKSDKSYLKGREYLEEMNAKTQDLIGIPKPTKMKNTGSKEFAEYTESMTLLIKQLNAGQPLPREEKLPADLDHKVDRDFLRKARIEMRLMNEKTNPSIPTSNKPSSSGNKSAAGAR